MYKLATAILLRLEDFMKHIDFYVLMSSLPYFSFPGVMFMIKCFGFEFKKRQNMVLLLHLLFMVIRTCYNVFNI